MINTINIRFANPSDFKTIRLFDPHSQYIDKEKIRNKIKQREIIIAQDKDKIVGIIKFSYFWQTRPYLDLIFIDPKCRKTGLSKKLLDFLIKHLVKNGYSYLFSSSEKQEPTAQAWHKHMGFKEMGELRDINLPHDATTEIFFSLKISDQKTLRKYPII